MEERLADIVCETVEELAAKHLTRTLEKSLEQILGPALIYDPRSLNIIAANNAAAEMYLCSKRELARRQLGEFFAPGEMEKLLLLTSDPSFEFSGSRVWNHLTNNEEPVFVEMHSNSLTVGHRTLRAVILREVTDRRRLEEFARDLTRILEMVARGDSGPDVLNALTRAIERQLPGALCSILVSNRERTELTHGAAPSLPPSYVEAIRVVPISASCGSCGTAAYRGEMVVVSDIWTDPLWKDYRDLAISHGLRACWSSPVFGAEMSVLGTFATYYKEIGEPDARSLEVIAAAAQIAGIVIQRVRTVEALRASEERYRDLFENANEIIFALDVAGLFTSANKAAEVAFGRPGEAVVGKRASNALESGATSGVLGGLGVQKDPHTQTTGHLTVRTWKGAELEVSYRILCEEGRPTGVQCIARDVTERRRLEERLLQAKKMDALARMLGGAAHELNNPLTSVIGYSELLNLRGNLSGEARECADMIRQEGERARQIVKNLLSFVHANKPQRTEFDLNRLIEALAKDINQRLESQNIKMILHLRPLPLCQPTRTS